MLEQVNHTDSKARILMVHNFYQIGGGEHTVYRNEVALLREHGHVVTEYTRSNDELKTSIIKKMLLPFSSVFNLKTYRDVIKIVKAEKIEIIHCHNTFPLVSPSVYYAAKKCKIPIIQTIHNFRLLCPNGVMFRNGMTCEDCLNKGLICSVQHNCYRDSKIQTLIVANMLLVHRKLKTYDIPHYIFLTEFNREKFRSLLGTTIDKAFIKPNFEYIDSSSFDVQRDGSFVYIGRLDKNKGIDFLVDNWTVEKDLYIFGQGALDMYVKEISNQNPKIHFMGFQPKNLFGIYLGKATAMIFPSDLYEGFPMTLIESFAIGTPVVCSDIGNGASIVKNNNAGVVFSRREKNSLLKAIEEVEDHFEMYSCNAKKAYKEKYTPSENYKKLELIYKAVMG